MARLRLKTVGAVAPVEFSVLGPVTEADLAVLRSAERRPKGHAPLRRITERHHAVARLLAGGTSVSHVAVITGLTPANIYRLRDDPSFQELVEFYRADIHDTYRSMHAQLAGIGEDALAELRDRLENEPEKMSNTFLLDLVTKVADRTGNGPTTRSTSEVHVTLDIASRMKAAREAARAAVIEAEARDVTPQEAAE